MPLTDSEKSQRGRIAAHKRWAKHDPVEHAQRMQAALRAKFEREADPEGVLPEPERQRRAEQLYKAHMASLAFKSAKARRRASEREGPGHHARALIRHRPARRQSSGTL